MSLPRPREGEPSNLLQPQLEVEVSSSSWGTNTNTNTTHNHSNNNNNNNNNNSNSNSLLPRSLVSHKKSKVEESDEDLFTVPDVEAQPPITNIDNPEIQNQAGFSGKRRRGRNPVDKEYRRLKRLLRNRVSAQQARERKKVYVNDLESRANELQDRNSKLEEKISTLINENTMLRKVLMNTRPKVDESVEPNQDQLSKS